MPFFGLTLRINEGLDEDKNPLFSNALIERYHVATKKALNYMQFSLAPDGSKTIKEDVNAVWEYQQKNDSNKVVSLMKNALIFECKNTAYTDFLAYKEDVKFIYETLLTKYEINNFERIGLRYINEIQIAGKDPVDWHGYVNSKLCHAIEAGIETGTRPLRSMHQVEIKKGEMNILFNYGIFNKDYPNPIARPELILDDDYYIRGILDKNEIIKNLENLNAEATQMFESCIDQKLRETMGVING